MADYTATLATWTVVVGLGTIALGLIAIGTAFYQRRDTKDAINLASREFIATHRPKIVVRFIQGPYQEDAGHKAASITIVNVGVTPAVIEAIGSDLVRRRQDGEFVGGFDARLRHITPVTLASGERHTFEAKSNSVFTDSEMFVELVGQFRTWVIGVVRYHDEDGVYRETGFCRVYDDACKSFVTPKGEEREYQD